MKTQQNDNNGMNNVTVFKRYLNDTVDCNRNTENCGLRNIKYTVQYLDK